MDQLTEDMSFERSLVSDYWDMLLDNKRPMIAKKMNCTTDQINDAVARLSKLDTSPGLQIGRNENHPITADVIIERNAEDDGYLVSLTDARIPNLRVNDFYSQMVRNRKREQ